MPSTITICLSLASLCLFSCAKASTSITIDPQQTSVSGLSSGGYMATQYQFAHAESVIGAGVIAAGPYYCAQNSINTALAECVTTTRNDYPITPLLDYLAQQQSEGYLASASAIASQRSLVIRGSLDQTINAQAAQLLAQQYAKLSSNPDHVVFIKDKPFAHVFPTIDKGGDCETSAPPFIGKCGFDAAGTILNHIYQDLNPPRTPRESNIVKISQDPQYTINDAELAEHGFAYVASSCWQGEACKVHVSFHGCKQNEEDVGLAYVTQTGFNRWAEANNMIILYPQTRKSSLFPMNPQGCWDWWGYTGEAYATKQGKQIQAIHNLIASLSSQLARLQNEAK